MTTIGKNVYVNVLDDIVKNYNNTIHNSIKMKPRDVKNNNLTEYIEEFNKKNLKYKIGDYVRISIFFLKVVHLIGQKKFLLLIK